MNNYKKVVKVRIREKSSNKNIFDIITTQRNRYEAEFGKEIVKYFYKHFVNIFVEPKFLPVGKPLNSDFLLINTLHKSIATRILLAFLTLFFLAPTINYAQTNNLLEEKTITGFVVNQNNEPWNNQIAELYEGNYLVATDTVRNGNFTFENINIVSVSDNEPFSTFTLSQNYPNPFNPSTIINYSIAKPQNISLIIYDILGREVKTLFSGYSSQGNFSISWNGFNNNGIGVSAGVYIYALKNKSNQIVKKMILLDGNQSNISAQNNVNNSNNAYPKTLNKSTEVYDYSIKIYGEDVITKVFSDFNFGNESPIDVGTLTAEAKPVLTGFVYDLDTKWNYETGERNTPVGLDSMKVFLATNPENFVFTNENGLFKIKLDSIPRNIVDTTGIFGPGWTYNMTIKDTLFVRGKNQGDTTYYNFRIPVNKKFDAEWPQPDGIHRLDNEIKYGTSVMTAFNDTTGIPMIKRWTDPEKGVDLLEYAIARLKLGVRSTNDPVWEGTFTRFKDEDFPLKVYMQSPPNSGYENNTMPGFEAISAGRFRFVRTMDSTEAQVQVKYDFNSIGQGTDLQGNYDEFGSYLTFWEISIGGPPYTTLDSALVAYVIAHEGMQIATAGGIYSPFIEDAFYHSSLPRFDEGYPLESPEREKRMNKLVTDLERNCKLLDYTK